MYAVQFFFVQAQYIHAMDLNFDYTKPKIRLNGSACSLLWGTVMQTRMRYHTSIDVIRTIYLTINISFQLYIWMWLITSQNYTEIKSHSIVCICKENVDGIAPHMISHISNMCGLFFIHFKNLCVWWTENIFHEKNS